MQSFGFLQKLNGLEPAVLKLGVCKLSVKRQRVNILGFVGHGVSVATIKLSCHSRKTVLGNIEMNGSGCVPTQFYLQTGRGPSLLTPGIYQNMLLAPLLAIKLAQVFSLNKNK